MKKITVLLLLFFTTIFIVSYGQYSKLYDFQAENDLVNSGYSQPVFDGTWLYDISNNGGVSGLGCIFKTKPDGTNYTKLLDFAGTTNGSNPYGSLIISGNVLYGMTYKGGVNNLGTIFKINIDGTGYTKLLDFAGTTNGSNPYGALTIKESVLYGMTYKGGTNNLGTIFKINVDGTEYTKLLDFAGTVNGSLPYGSLTLSGSILYGMNSGGGVNNKGTIFKINIDGTQYTKLLDFAGTTNGSCPYGSLTLSGSEMYGMTCLGGINNYGVIFKINTDGTNYTKLLDFTGTTNGKNPYGCLTLFGSVMYGMTCYGGVNNLGTIFKINTDGTGYNEFVDFSRVTNGSNPMGSFTLFGTVLFGTSFRGGISNKGVVFKINTDGSSFSKILDYNIALNGCRPYGSLTSMGSVLYGMTCYGGANGLGNIFKINSDGTGYINLMNFEGTTNGSTPFGALTPSGSALYGMTSSGGTNNYGIIFKINTDGTGFTKLFDFAGITSGKNPTGSLIISDTVLYGTTANGGINNYGTIFKINTDGTGYLKLLDFDGATNGRWPFGTLTLSGSNLFGMTSDGGINNNGVIFKISMDGSGYTKLLDFNEMNGGNPQSSLTLSGTVLYGMTCYGGANSLGSIFKINLDGTGFAKLLDFNLTTNGGYPNGSLTLSGSVLYGMTNKGGINGFGTIFKINTDATGFIKLQDFNISNGKCPMNSDLALSSNTLYGMTETGGTMQAGVIFKYELTPPITPIIEVITQPTCNLATGSILISGLPALGTWTLKRIPGGVITTGTGTVATISGLEEGIYTYTITDNKSGLTSSASANVIINTQPEIPTAPTIGVITQPNCSVATGSVVLNGLPSTGTWTLTKTPEGSTSTGTGTSTTITGLTSGIYTYTVTNASGCLSSASANVIINTQPEIPTAPTIGVITQPNCSVATGSVVLNGLPSTGTWTLTKTPEGSTSTGTGTSTTITGLTSGIYTYTVTNASGCTSLASSNMVINVQPSTPSAPVVGIITQPTMTVATGSVVLNDLPATGTWTLIRSPETISSTGTGVTTTIIGLATGIYNYTVTNASGCISGASANIVINPQPTSGIDNGCSQTGNFLGQNFPNPFHFSTTIEFSIVRPSYVKITVFNTLGKEVDIITDEYLTTGIYTKLWEPKNLPNGIYYYQLKLERYKETRRLIIMK